MTTTQQTVFIDAPAPHIAEGIALFIEKNLPELTVTTDENAAFSIVCRSGKIILHSPHNDDDVTISTPVKMAVLMQKITHLYRQSRPIYIGPYLFDYTARTLTEASETLHLTEKEADVLHFLHRKRGTGITRDDLLKEVWNYADGIDTHTIETHIYRLRQKIEKNPEHAEILLTKEDGYHLVTNV